MPSSSSSHMDDDDDDSPSTPGKFKPEKSPYLHKFRNPSANLTRLAFSSFLFLGLILVFFFKSPSSSSSPYSSSSSHLYSSSSSDLSRRSLKTSSWGGPTWEKRVKSSAQTRTRTGFTVLVTGAAGFIGTHVSAALKRRGDGVLGLDNFNDYYDPSLKRARQSLLERSGIFIVEGDINDTPLLNTLFHLIPFTHVIHLAAQAGVRYAAHNPTSYIHSNIAGFVNLLEACKNADPQPAIIWASSSSVYGLNTKSPFSEKDRTDQPASLYAATKKAGEEIAHAYNHIYGLSLTALRFFTVYGPWGRPDMAYFFFTRDILKGKVITVFESGDGGAVARDFTYIGDIVKGCLGAVDTAEGSTGSGGRKRRGAMLRVLNLGNTVAVAVGEMVVVLEKVLKVKAKVRVVKIPMNGDVRFTHANVSAAMREFGYRPGTDLQSGLKKFVRWYLSYYGSGKKTVHS